MQAAQAQAQEAIVQAAEEARAEAQQQHELDMKAIKEQAVNKVTKEKKVAKE